MIKVAASNCRNGSRQGVIARGYNRDRNKTCVKSLRPERLHQEFARSIWLSKSWDGKIEVVRSMWLSKSLDG